MGNTTYLLYTDGACRPNPGKGGWAFILVCPDGQEIIKSGNNISTTNNRMEAISVLEGIKCFLDRIRVAPRQNNILSINSDSKYLLSGISHWCDNWYRKGWKKSNGKDVLNLDLWKEIYLLKQGCNFICNHIKGHSGHPQNERCDELAVKEIIGT